MATSGPDRDRDPSGRARNARPRDELGRPLPRGASGVERVPDELHVGVPDGIALAQHYLDGGQPFHAHEVLESLWKTRPDSERDLWQGLAQLAVGATHALRGNLSGAAALITRGSARIARYDGEAHGIAVNAVLAWAAETTASLISDGNGSATPYTLSPLRLR